jgi:hypothetical protein
MLRRFLLLIISAVSAAITTACGHRPVDDPLFSKISMQALVDKSSQGRLECPSEAHIGASAGQLWGGTGAQRVEADTSCKVNRRAEPPFEEAKFMSALGTELQQRISNTAVGTAVMPRSPRSTLAMNGRSRVPSPRKNATRRSGSLHSAMKRKDLSRSSFSPTSFR